MKTNYHVELLPSNTEHERSVTKFGDEALGIPVDVKIVWFDNGAKYSIQSMTFDGDKWDKKGIRSWLKNKSGLFKGAKITEVIPEPLLQKKFTKETRKVPVAALKLKGTVPIKFVAAKKEGEKDRFQIQANSGRIMPHWYWGNMAVDLEGLTIGRDDMPVFLEHAPADKVGWTDGFKIDPKLGLIAVGYFSSITESSKEVRDLAADGYPWQASVYVPPTDIEYVEKGETVNVNGYELKGPGVVFRKSNLREVSVCALGADECTSSSMLSGSTEELEIEINVLSEKEHEMKYADITLVTLRENRPELVEEIEKAAQPTEETFTAKSAEAVTAERTRCSGIITECAAFGLPDTAASLIADESIIEDAKARLKAIKLEGQKLGDVGDPGVNSDPDATDGKFAGLTGDELLKAHFKANHNGCADEFEEAAHYIAYCKAAGDDKVTILTNKSTH